MTKEIYESVRQIRRDLRRGMLILIIYNILMILMMAKGFHWL